MNERIAKVVSHSVFKPAVSGAVSLAAGLGIGYFIGRRTRDVVIVKEEDVQLTFDYNPNALKMYQDEMTYSDNYTSTNQAQPIGLVPAEDIKDDVVAVGEEFVAEQIKSAMTAHKENDDEEALTITNVFAGTDLEWDYEAEILKRTKAEPYVIHKDEFYEDALGYAQSSLTYYSGDDILVDQEDAPIYNYKNTVGVMMFGHGSGDPNVFYVRNDKNKAEYEILRDTGQYSVDVLGLEIEDNVRVEDLRHSDSPRKFRMD